MSDPITTEYLHESFLYFDGDLIWRKRPLHHFKNEHSMKVFNSRQAGTKAGTLRNGYLTVNFAIGRILGHRAIFKIHHGYLPPEVDHIDGDISNNRIENLRPASHAENLKNMKTPTTNTSGVKGVSFHRNSGKWIAYIRSKGKMKHLGIFGDLSLAAAARKEAEKVEYGEFANGR